jgi:hypothetical protein
VRDLRYCGLQDTLYLGNLDSKRDWGHARDYVEAQWLILQQEQPEDYVIATGEQHSVREFVDAAALELGMAIRWEGAGLEEKGCDEKGGCVIAVDSRYIGQPKLIRCRAIRLKRRNNLGGHRRSASESLSLKWFVKTSNPPSATNWSNATAICRTTTTNSAVRIADRIYVASHAGPVGSALLRSGGYANLITRSNAELDLTDLRATRQFSANQDCLETQMAGAD